MTSYLKREADPAESKERQWTVDDMMMLDPCYSRTRVTELWGRHKALTTRQMMRLPIPAKDRVWAAMWTMPVEARAVAVELIVTRAVMTHAVACGVPKLEAWALAWLSGENRSSGSAYAAFHAVRDVRHPTYSNAAYYAAAAYAAAACGAAAWHDAAYAAYAAAVAAGDAANAANDAANAERIQQVRDILMVLR